MKNLILALIGTASVAWAEPSEDYKPIEKAMFECLQRSKSDKTYLNCMISARQQMDDVLNEIYGKWRATLAANDKIGKEGQRRLDRHLGEWPKAREAECRLLSLNENAGNEARAYEYCLIIQAKARFATFSPYYIK